MKKTGEFVKSGLEKLLNSSFIKINANTQIIPINNGTGAEGSKCSISPSLFSFYTPFFS